MVEGVFTHFATADEAIQSFARAILSCFQEVIGSLNSRPPLVHAANSAAALSLPDSRSRSQVRAGIAIYGLTSPDVTVPPELHPRPSNGSQPSRK